MNNVIIANIVLGISLMVNVITMQQKRKKNILIGFIIVNILTGITYFILKTYSAMVVSMVSIVQTYIKYLFDIKERKIPSYIKIIFIITSTLTGVLTFTNIIDIFPIFCLITYTLSILQQKEKNIRLLTILNSLGWMIYDIFILAYVGVLFSICTITSTVVSIFRYDLNKKEN